MNDLFRNLPAMAFVKNVVIGLAMVAVIQLWHLFLCQTNAITVLPYFTLVALDHQPHIVYIKRQYETETVSRLCVCRLSGALIEMTEFLSLFGSWIKFPPLA